MVHQLVNVVSSSLVRMTWRKVYLGTLSVTDRLFGKQSEMIPRICRWDGKNASELKATGEQFLNYFIDVCGVAPDARVLDIGCGIGRIAVPLTHYLTPLGSYEGLDIIPEAISWCSRKITPKYPNFQFQLADVANQNYNPKGAFRAAEYTFPYEDMSFDFVFLGSVFTHMLPQEVERYLSEIRRVLKAGGKSLSTYFLLTSKSLDRIEQGGSTLSFTHSGRGFRSISDKVPEIAVAYEESYIKSLYVKNRLVLIEPIKYGTWSHDFSDFEYQDFIVAYKLKDGSDGDLCPS
jgi:SAM-dependent methyltransferase